MKVLQALLFLLCFSINAASAQEVLTVGMDGGFPPFNYIKNQDSGRIVGFDVDLLDAISRKAGFRYQIEQMAFKDILFALRAGRLDIGISGIAVTRERKRIIDFSKNYYRSGLGILVRDKSLITGLADLNGRKVGVFYGTVCTPFINKKVVGAEIVLYRSFDLMVEGVTDGEVDAIIADSTLLVFLLKQKRFGSLKRVGRIYNERPLAIAFPKGSQWLEKVNTALVELKKSGEYAEIYKKWIGDEPLSDWFFPFFR